MKPFKVFYSMLVVFLLIVLYFIFGQDYARILFPIVAVLGLIFLILGIILIVKTSKSKIDKKLKISLILVGSSAVAVPVFAVLHNLVYALMITLIEGYRGDEAFFFIMSLIVSPIIFIVASIYSLIKIKKK